MSKKTTTISAVPAPKRRRWSDDEIVAVIAKYEALPKTGGHRTRYLDEIGVPSAMISQWRSGKRRTRATAARHRPGPPSRLPEGVVAPPPVVLPSADGLTDTADADNMVRQLVAWRDRLLGDLKRCDAAIDALRPRNTVQLRA